jgi:hypothetical protein
MYYETAPLSIGYPTLIEGEVGLMVEVPPAVTAGGRSTSFSLSAPLPKGLTFNKEDGSISGIPTVAFPSSRIMIRASNSVGEVARPFDIVIDEMPKVPSVLRKTAAEAVELLTAEGYEVEDIGSEEVSEESKAGLVAKQSIKGGSAAVRGTKVGLTFTTYVAPLPTADSP